MSASHCPGVVDISTCYVGRRSYWNSERHPAAWGPARFSPETDGGFRGELRALAQKPPLVLPLSLRSLDFSLSLDPAPAATSRFALRNLRRNAALLLIHGLLGQTGFRLLQAPTFLPTYVQLLTGAEWAVGAARAAQSLGMFLSPLVGAGLIGRSLRVRGLTLLFGFGMRLQIGLLALLALFAPLETTRTLLWPILFGWGLANGLQAVTFNVLLAKSVPVRARGRLWGIRNLGSGLVLLFVSAFAGVLLERHGFPIGFGYTFAVAFGLTSIGLACLCFLREPDARQVAAAADGIGTRIRTAVRLFSDDQLGPFLRTVALITASRGALPYFIIAVAAGSGVDGATLALLTIVFSLAQATSSLGWGVLADRIGFRAVYRGSILAWLVASSIVLISNDPRFAVLLFLLLGIGLAGTMICQSSMVLEFGSEGQRALLVAASSTVAEGFGTIGFLGAALLTHSFSLDAVFWSAATLQLLAWLQTRRLSEPRTAATAIPSSHDG